MFSKNGRCDWRRSAVVTEMFLHLEMSSVLRRLQCRAKMNKDLSRLRAKTSGLHFLIHTLCNLWSLVPLTCQWCYDNRRGRDAAACGGTVPLVLCLRHWYQGNGWGLSWWGFGSAWLLTPSWCRWSPAAWTETDAGGLGSTPPEEKSQLLECEILHSGTKLKHLPSGFHLWDAAVSELGAGREVQLLQPVES